MQSNEPEIRASFGRRFWRQGLLGFGLPVAISATVVVELLDLHFSAQEFLRELVFSLLIGAPLCAFLWTLLFTNDGASSRTKGSRGD